MSHEPRGPKSTRQEPGGSTSECLTLAWKDTIQKFNRQEPVSSTSDWLTLVLKKIRHVKTKNMITSPSISNTYITE